MGLSDYLVTCCISYELIYEVRSIKIFVLLYF